jgi:hypothetical protein
MKRVSWVMVAACVLSWGQGVRADIWIRGHGDIGAALTGGELELHYHFEDDAQGANGTITAGEYGPSAFSIAVPNPSVARPAGSAWDFLGAPTDQVWFLPQSSDPDKPFLGFGLEDLTASDWNGALTWNLVGMTAPAGGSFALWQNDAFGNPTAFMSTVDGISTADSFSQVAGGHEHFNLGFTREGIFELQFRISGTHNTLGFLSNTATFAFVSGVPEPSSMALLGCTGAGCIAGWWRRRGRRPAPRA